MQNRQNEIFASPKCNYFFYIYFLISARKLPTLVKPFPQPELSRDLVVSIYLLKSFIVMSLQVNCKRLKLKFIIDPLCILIEAKLKDFVKVH